MAEIAKLQIGENSYEFPVIEGSENELAIDIKTLKRSYWRSNYYRSRI